MMIGEVVVMHYALIDMSDQIRIVTPIEYNKIDVLGTTSSRASISISVYLVSIYSILLKSILVYGPENSILV